MSLIAKDFEGIERSVLCDESGRLVTGNLSDYGFDKFEDTNPAYVGYLRTNDNWYIMRLTTTGNTMLAEYCKGDASYTTNWTNRASLTYGTYAEIFGF